MAAGIRHASPTWQLDTLGSNQISFRSLSRLNLDKDWVSHSLLFLLFWLVCLPF